MTPPAPDRSDSEVILHGPVAAHLHLPKRVSGRWRRWLVVGLLAVVAAGGAAAGTGMLDGFLPHPVVAGDPDASGHYSAATPSPAPTVKVIHPRRDPSVQVTVEQLAVVEPYYRADLRARASGLVRAVHKDIGDRVERGEVLVEIDVPDAVQEVAQKEAIVGQRRQELRVARSHLKNAEAGREVARAAIKEKLALVAQAEATRDYRLMLLERLRGLGKSDSVPPGAIREQERDYKASEAAVEAAKAAVERARADATEDDSTVEAAAADIDLKAALIEVARRDLDRARAVADYARVVAPFDGVIVRRNVDPGSFVQNATTGQSEALISVDRSDLVTVVAKFPDAAAPFVTEHTGAEVTIDSLPGVTINGRVTRFTPSIQSNDRTIRVEVDLFNGDEVDYRRIVDRTLGAELAPLSAACPWFLLGSRLAEHHVLLGLHKGGSGFLPVGGLPHSPGDAPRRLLPGMSGSVKLLLRQFHDGCVLPSTAVYSRSGKPYVLLVEEGVTKQFPVVVQLNDGRVAKVAYVHRQKDANGVTRDVISELTGGEMVVASRQLEIGEGAAVHPAPSEW